MNTTAMTPVFLPSFLIPTYFVSRYASLASHPSQYCCFVQLVIVSEISQQLLLERFIYIYSANKIVVTLEGKRRSRTPLYLVGIQGSTLEFHILSQRIKSSLSAHAKAPIRVVKRKGWNALCSLLTRSYRDPLTWGISIEELRARSFASSRKVSSEVAT